MECLHPKCPLGGDASTWTEVLASTRLELNAEQQRRFARELGSPTDIGNRLDGVPAQSLMSQPFGRLLELCPCLYAQLPVKVSAKAIVHLCEVTIGTRIVSSNVVRAFEIQHPKKPWSPFKHPPRQAGAGGGDVMEALCGEVLTNHGVPHMDLDNDGWPKWGARAHVSLNRGKFRRLKLYGDFLVPSAPHNLLISVKSEAARERLVLSGNRLESVGFGFFSSAREFWTEERVSLLKRWGFVAIYMPTATLKRLNEELVDTNRMRLATNINGRDLFRDLNDFGDDMFRVAGKVSLDL